MTTAQDPHQRKHDLARGYIERGRKLLLLQPDTKKPINRWRFGKKDGFDPAAVPKGQGPRPRQRYLRSFAASSDPALIRAWIDEWPDAGLGVDCAASMLFAIDLDQKPVEKKDGSEALTRVFLHYFPAGDNLVERLDYERDCDPRIYRDPPLPGSGPRNPFGPPLLSRSPSGGQHLIYSTIDPLLGEPMPDPWAITDLGHAVLGVKGLDIKWNGFIGIPNGDGHREWLNDVVPGPMPVWLYDALASLRGARAGVAAEPGEPGLWMAEDIDEYLALLNVVAFRHDGAWEEDGPPSRLERERARVLLQVVHARLAVPLEGGGDPHAMGVARESRKRREARRGHAPPRSRSRQLSANRCQPALEAAPPSRREPVRGDASAAGPRTEA